MENYPVHQIVFFLILFSFLRKFMLKYVMFGFLFLLDE